MSGANGLDRTDYRILSVLQQDASLSVAEIAKAAGVSQSSCCRRQQRLKEEGYISHVVALLDRQKLGLRTQLFLQIRVDRKDPTSLAEFADAVRAFPEVMECHVVLGIFDFLLRVLTKDLDAYNSFYIDKLSRVPHFIECVSLVGSSEIKRTTALPLHI